MDLEGEESLVVGAVCSMRRCSIRRLYAESPVPGLVGLRESRCRDAPGLSAVLGRVALRGGVETEGAVRGREIKGELEAVIGVGREERTRWRQ